MTACKYRFRGKEYASYKDLVDELRRLGLDSGIADALYSKKDDAKAVTDRLEKIRFERGSRKATDDETVFSSDMETKDGEMSVMDVINTPEFATEVGGNRMPILNKEEYAETMKQQFVESGQMTQAEADEWALRMMDRWKYIMQNAFDFHRIIMGGPASAKSFKTRCEGTVFAEMPGEEMMDVEEQIFKKVLFDSNSRNKVSGEYGTKIIRGFNFNADLNVLGGKVLGHVDYVVTNEDGTVELYNIKTSTQPYSKWSWEMKQRYNYEMAMLKRMLEYNGVDMKYARTHIIPVQIEYDENFEKVRKINVQDIQHTDMTYFNSGLFTKYDRAAKKFVDSTIEAKKVSFGSIKTVNGQLKAIFPKGNVVANGAMRTAKDWVRFNWKRCNPKPRPGGGYILTLEETGEKVEVSDKRRGERNAEFVELIAKKNAEDFETMSGEKDKRFVLNDVKKSYYNDGFYECKLKGRKIKSYLENKFKKYFVHTEEGEGKSKKFIYEWELEESDVLDSANILVFYNTKTNQTDVIDITQLDPGQKITFKAGRKNLLGSYLMDVNKEGFTMEANYGNIEMVRCMALLNEILPSLGSRFELGQLHIIAPNMYNSKQGATYDFESVVKNWNTIVKVVNENTSAKIENRFGSEQISIIEQRKVLNDMWKTICSNGEYDVTEIKALGNVLEKHIDIYGNEKPGLMNVSDVDSQIRIINEFLEEIRRAFSDEIRFGNTKELIALSKESSKRGDVAKLFIQASKVLSMLHGDCVVNSEDINFIQKNMLKPTSMNNNIIRRVGFLLQKTIDAIRGSVLEVYNNDIIECFNDYYKESGYSKMRNVVIGDQSAAFKSLYEYDEEGDNTMMFKNPYDESNDLKGYERKFLKRILYEFYKIRCRMLGTRQEVSGVNDSRLVSGKLPEGYLRAPLEKASINTRRADIKGMFERLSDRLHRTVADPYGTLDEIRKYLTEEDQIDISKTAVDDMRTINPFADTELDYENWEKRIIEKGAPYFEKNIENLFIDYLFRQIRCEEMNKLLFRTSGIELSLAIKGTDENNVREIDEIINYIDEYLKKNIFEADVSEKGTRVFNKLIEPLRRLVSRVFISNNPYAFVRDIMQGLEANFVRVASKFQTGASMKDLVWAYGFVMKDSMQNLSHMSLLNQMNIKYGFSNFDAGRVADRLKTGRGGVLNPDHWRYWSLRAPDYLNRMTLFVAMLRHDGSFDAYSLDGKGRLTYDWRKDKRFDVYKDPSKSGTPEYKKQQALYMSFVRQLNIENPDLKLSYTDDLPDGYTMEQIRSLKTLGESIYGAYDTASRNRAENMTIGRNFMFFFTWLNGMLDNYFKGTQLSSSQLQTRQATDYNGKKIYFKEDGTITNEETDMPVMEDVPVIVQGVFNTIGMTLKEITDPEFDSKYFMEQVKDNPQLMANFRRIFADLMVAILMGLLYTLWAKPAYKQYKSEADGQEFVKNVTAELLYKGWSRSYDVFTGPLAIVKYFGENTNPISYELGTKFIKDTYKVLAGKSAFGATMLSYDAFYRSMQDSAQAWMKSNDYNNTFVKKTPTELKKEKEERKG